MRQSVSTVRVLSYALLAVAVAAGTTGCFKRGVKGDYALAPEMRPLEVPPDLNLPATTGDNKVPTLASATKPAARWPRPGRGQHRFHHCRWQG
jgi:uncharacterized lipoprotein